MIESIVLEFLKTLPDVWEGDFHEQIALQQTGYTLPMWDIYSVTVSHIYR